MSNFRKSLELPLVVRVPDRSVDPATALSELGSGDALLLEWGEEPRGLFAWLSAASLIGRNVLPARWLPVRPVAKGGSAHEERLLWVARSDAALRRLFSERPPDPQQLSGSARPDEPFALLGVPGDAITCAAADPFEVRRRAELWLHRLGSDRVAVAVSQPSQEQPLAMLARRRRLPLLQLTTADAAQLAQPAQSESQRLSLPLLQSDFQLDAEHRLPDEHYVPGLRDLLHRGSLLRERTLFERLPLSWRLHCEAELRALYGWQLSPLLRRAAVLLQTFLPVPDVQLRTPLPRTGGVVAYLLGLSDQRPDEGVLAADASGVVRHLVGALQAWDRQVEVEVDPAAWPMLGSRLSPWAEAGHLAACEEKGGEPDFPRRLCFSGQPLWLRTTLRRSGDGLPLAPLTEEDRRALGWFELRLHTSAQQRTPSERSQSHSPAPFPFIQRTAVQLPLQLEGMTA